MWSLIKTTCSVTRPGVWGGGLFGSLTVGHSGKWESVWMWLTRPDVSINICLNVPLYIFIFVRRVNDGREESLLFFFSCDVTLINDLQTLTAFEWNVFITGHKAPGAGPSLHISVHITAVGGWALQCSASFDFENIYWLCHTVFWYIFVKKLHRLKACVVLMRAVLQLCLCNVDQLQTWNE